MLGLRTQETEKFNAFFNIIQNEAKAQAMVFFADAGDGNEFETDDLEGENMMGWLVPVEKANAFEEIWREEKVDDSWSDFFKWAIWTSNDGKIKIKFED